MDEVRDELNACCRVGDGESVKKMIQEGVDVLAVDDGGNLALHHAAFGGNIDALDAVAAASFSRAGVRAINARNGDNASPLFFACAEGHVAAVRLLLSYGAKQDVRNNAHSRPLDWAKNEETRQALTTDLQELQRTYQKRERDLMEQNITAQGIEEGVKADEAIQAMLVLENERVAAQRVKHSGLGVMGETAQDHGYQRLTLITKIHNAQIDVDRAQEQNTILSNDIHNLQHVEIPNVKAKLATETCEIRDKIEALRCEGWK